MTNYENLKKHEEEKEKVFQEVGEDDFLDMESDYDFPVECVSTGKKGYAESYLDSTDICFTVPSEDLTEYRISREEFNKDFIQKP